MVQSYEMRDAFLNLSKTVCLLLQNQFKAGAPLLTQKRKRISWISNNMVITTYSVYNIIEFLKRHMSIIGEIEEYTKCIETMRNNDVVNNHLENRVGAFTQAYILQTPAVIELFLTHLISNLKALEFEITSFLKTYQTMEDFFYKDVVSVEVFAHLEGFVSNQEELNLGNGWTISKLSQVDLENLLSEGLIKDNLQMLGCHAIFWRLEVPKVVLKKDEEFDSPVEYQRNQRTVREIISTLRLFKIGDIGIRRIITRFIGWQSTRRSVSTSYVKPFWGPSYTLELSELNDFRNLLNMIQSTPKDSAFELAINRLGYAVERQHAHDRILDFMIAFEALFLFKKDSKKPTLPGRVATMIQNANLERNTVIENLEFAYDLRNSIAHGDTDSEIRQIIQKIGQPARKFVGLVGSYLRKALREYLVCLSKGMSKAQIIQKLTP